MNKKVLLTLSLIGTILISSCGSKDDSCTKMMNIPHYALQNKILELYYVTEEVSCDFVVPENHGPLELKNFTYEVLNFSYVLDTGNNKTRIKFEIKFNNPNNYPVEGLALITMRPSGDNFEYTGNYSNLASVPCHAIAANSSCTFTFDHDYTYNSDIGGPDYMEIVDVKYYIAN